MSKGTVILPVLILIYITYFAVSIPIEPRVSLNFGLGGKGNDSKPSVKASVGAGVDSNDKDEGKVGGSISTNFSFKSILKKLSSWSVKIPTQLAMLPVTLAEAPITLPLKLAKAPVTLTKESASLTWAATKKSAKGAMSALSKGGSLGSQLGSSVMSGTKALTGKTVRALTGSNIFGIQISYEVANWFAQKINSAVEGSMKLTTMSMAEASKLTESFIKMLHVKDILNLPGVKKMVARLKDVNNWNKDTINENYVQLGNFITSIIEEHSDFFIPILHKTLNVFLAFTNGLQQIQDGGKMTGVSAKLGSWEFALGPLISGSWHIIGPGGKTIQGGSGEEGGMAVGGTVKGEAGAGSNSGEEKGTT